MPDGLGGCRIPGFEILVAPLGQLDLGAQRFLEAAPQVRAVLLKSDNGREAGAVAGGLLMHGNSLSICVSMAIDDARVR